MGLTASNSDYDNQIFSAFTDFGTPAAGGIPARPGLQRYPGHRRRSADRMAATLADATLAAAANDLDTLGGTHHRFRRFESIAFDQYGYFSQSIAADGHDVDSDGWNAHHDVYRAERKPPIYGGSLFVSDLASGLYVTVTPLAPLTDQPDLGARSRLAA